MEMMTPFYLMGLMQVVSFLGYGGSMGVPLGLPPAPEDPIIAKTAPDECLYYMSWAGMAEPDAQSANKTERLLAEPEVRQSVAKVWDAVFSGFRSWEEDDEEYIQVIDNIELIAKTVLTRPTAVYMSDFRIDPRDEERTEVTAGLIVNLGEKSLQINAALGRLERLAQSGGAPAPELVGRWRTFRLPFDSRMQMNVFGQYLIIGIGKDEGENIIQRSRTPVPKWLAEARKKLDFERPASLNYIDMSGVIRRFGEIDPEVLQVMTQSRMVELGTMVSGVGMDGEATISKTIISFSGKLDEEFKAERIVPLLASDLQAIPADATMAAAWRIDADECLRRMNAWAQSAGDMSDVFNEIFDEMLGEIQSELDIDRHALLQSVGTRWRVYSSPGQGGFIVTGATLVVDIRDRQKLLDVEKALLERIARESEEYMDTPLEMDTLTPLDETPRDDADSDDAPVAEDVGPPPSFRTRPCVHVDTLQFAGETIRTLDVPEDDFFISPSWCITEDELIVSIAPQYVKGYLTSRASRSEANSLASVPSVARCFQEGREVILVGRLDMKKIVETAYPILPIASQTLFAEMQREGLDMDVTVIPSAKAIIPHITDTTLVVYRSASGDLVIESQQTLPMGGLLQGMPMLMFMSLGVANF